MVDQTFYAPGAFCWVGLATSDPAAATTFYATLFGWQAEELSAGVAGSYTLLRRNGKEVAILYRQTPEARAALAPPHWTSFISVEDAEATAARAGELGGKAVFRTPFDVVDHGRVAAVQDPIGATVSLWEPRSKVGAALANDVGALSWTELVTPDVVRARCFYRDLLEWRYEMDATGYTTIRSAGRPTGGMRQQTEQEHGDPPSWRPYFGVESADDAVRRAEQAGGRTLAPARETTIGRSALVADPQGAAFALIEREMPPPALDCAGGREGTAVEVAESGASRRTQL